jgi:serine/threonine protein kinase
MKPDRWQQITGIFQAARAHPPPERDAFVADACRDDPALRLEVEAMLAGHDDAGQFGDTLGVLSAAGVPSAAPHDSTSSVRLGAVLGPYTITARLGRGGMGEVFRAHDARLNRDVAIKTLPSAFAARPDRLARFRREARVLASLNHPNIAAIYGLETSGDLDHLVLELVDGQALKGPLPVRTALEYGRQVAAALEAAHDKGIIHRDLKPANVKVTPAGRVKVLDFGLAKAISPLDDTDCLSPSMVTMTTNESVAGHIVGSPPYMSPEQARGHEVDERTDIWAFGCLLYELLSGSRAFRGDTAIGTSASAALGGPDWKALPGDTPASVRELLRQCLTKESARRIQSIADVRRAIERAQRGWTRLQRGAMAAAALATLAIGLAVWSRRPVAPPNRSEWSQITRLPDSVSQPSLSPDGRQVAFIRGAETFYGRGQVYVKALPDGEPIQLTHDTLKKMSPAFSPDGLRIAYTTVNELFEWDTWIVPALGGEPRPWLRNASGLTWTAPQQLMFSEIGTDPHMGIAAADESGAHHRTVYLPAHEHAMTHRSYLSPDGKWVLLVQMDKDHAWASCRIVPIDGSSPGRDVGPPHAGCTFGAWSVDGQWIFVTSDAGGAHHIWRERFPGGQPEQITFGPTVEEGIAMAPDGRSLISAVALQNGSIWLHDASGERQVSALEGTAVNAKFTRDGKKLCYVIVKEYPSAYTSQPGELWVADLDSGASAALVPGLQAFDYDVAPDGRHVVLEVADRDGRFRLWLAPVDRRSPPRQIPNVEGRQPRFGPDGDIFFRASGFAYRVRADGIGLRKAIEQPVLLLTGISPDGRWLVAWSPLDAERAMAYQAFPLSGGPPIEISRDIEMKWSSDGRALSLWDGPIAASRSYIISLPPGEALPPAGAEGFRFEADVARVPGARRIDAVAVPGPSAGVYAFYRDTSQRNLYRIPLQ